MVHHSAPHVNMLCKRWIKMVFVRDFGNDVVNRVIDINSRIVTPTTSSLNSCGVQCGKLRVWKIHTKHTQNGDSLLVVCALIPKLQELTQHRFDCRSCVIQMSLHVAWNEKKLLQMGRAPWRNQMLGWRNQKAEMPEKSRWLEKCFREIYQVFWGFC